jgi:Anti-sigma-K factor rskA, C-terminal
MTVQKHNRVAFLLWAGLVALLLLAFYSAWDARRLQNEIRSTNSRAIAVLQQRHKLLDTLATQERAARILNDPASVKILLPSHDPGVPQLQACWHPQLGILVTGQEISRPSGNRVLQLWLIPTNPRAKPLPSLTFRPESDGTIFLLAAYPPAAMSGIRSLAITEEPSGGSFQLTASPRWLGHVH